MSAQSPSETQETGLETIGLGVYFAGFMFYSLITSLPVENHSSTFHTFVTRPS